MTLQSSGAISLNDIHVEAGGGSGTAATINDTDIRALIGKASGTTMSFNEWYGASSSIDTGWLNPTYSFASIHDSKNDPAPTSGANAWNGSSSNGFSISCGHSTQGSGSTVAYLSAISASNILQWGVRYYGTVASAGTNQAFWWSTTSASNSAGAPVSLSQSWPNGSAGAGNYSYTHGPTSSNFVTANGGTISGSSSTYCGTGTVARNWWAGGAGFIGGVYDYAFGSSGQVRYIQVRVIYQP